MRLEPLCRTLRVGACDYAPLPTRKCDTEGTRLANLSHIADDRHTREIEAVERVLVSQGPSDIIRPRLQAALGWGGRWCWYAIRIPVRYLALDLADANGVPGDIDIMGGPLTAAQDDLFQARKNAARALHPNSHSSWIDLCASQSLLQAGKLDWPPNLGSIGASEVKTAYMDSGKRRHVRHDTAAKGLRQAEGLVELGFDRVALLWIATNEPGAASGFGAWLDAGAEAASIAELVRRRSKIDEAQRFGQLVIRLGAVAHAPERHAGTISLDVLREPPPLPVLPGSSRALRRARVELFLRDAFLQSDHAPSAPVVIRFCGSCRRGYIALPPECRRCSRCGLDGA